jgi:hypothetical protein
MRARQMAVLVVVAALAACAPTKPTIRTNADSSVNLSSFKTYAFAPHPGTDRGEVSTPLTSYFKDAIRREMDSRGYRYVESGDADLMVNFNANSRENADLRSTPSSASVGYYGYRGGMYGGMRLSSAPNVETVRYKVGTANVDVVDPQKKQVVWEGIAEGELTDEMMKDPRAAVSAVITDLFAKFPGRAGV